MNSGKKQLGLDTYSDNALMLKVKDGDIGKMGLLFERHHRQMYRFFFNMTRERELSEDMVQNVFMRMLRYPDGFRGFGEFRTWMYHIARNTLYDHLRKARRNPVTSRLNDPDERIDGEIGPDRKLEKDQDLEMLEAAMQGLSDDNRELLVLSRFQDLKYSEIATLMNTTEGAVKVRVHRAMLQLKNNYMNLRK